MVFDQTPDFWIGKYLIRPKYNEVSFGKTTIQVEYKVMQVLLCLASQPGTLISREILLEEVWKGSLVTEETLSRCISLLRKVFKDDAHNPKVIQTIRNKGYRLIAPVTSHKTRESAITNEGPPQKRNIFSKALGIFFGFVFLIFILGVLGKASKEKEKVWKTIRVTAEKGVESQPAISPDGSRIAYYKYTDLQSEGDVYLTIPGGDGSTKQLTNLPGHETSPVWSPDSKSIAFQHVTATDRALYVLPAIGGTPHLVGKPNEVLFEKIAWLPDSSGLAYIDRENSAESYGIYFLDIQSGKTERITHPTNQHWGDYNPAFSPDGTQMSFLRGVSAGTHGLFLLDLESGEEKQLTINARRALGQVWDPLNKQIIYATSEGYKGTLWQLQPNTLNSYQGGQAMNLWGEDPSIAASGKSIAVEDLSYDYDIQMISLNTSQNQAALTELKELNSTKEDHSPAFSPDGQHLVFVSSRSGNAELWLMNWQSKQISKLTSFEGLYLSATSWAPDGSKVLFNAFTSSGNADIYLLELSTLQIQPVLHTEYNEIAPAWAPDGSHFYYGSNQSGTWQIWNYRLDSKASRQITKNGGYRAIPDEVGKLLYFSKYDEIGIWEMTLESEQTKRIIEAVHLYDWGNWLVDDQFIYYASRQSPFKPVTLTQYDLTTYQNCEILKLKATPSLPGLAKHPISGELFITQTLYTECDIVMHVLVD